MRLIAFIVGLVVYLTCQSVLAWYVGIDGWTIFWFGVAALVLAQVIYLIWIGIMARQEMNRRAQDGATPADTAAPTPKGIKQPNATHRT